MSESLPPFLAACRRQPVPHTPIWIMRQAGRYLPEYRALREKHDFLTLMRTPELAAQVTLQPIERFALDAAILFADIMTPLDDLGLGLRFAPGPVLDHPLSTARAVETFVARPHEGRFGAVEQAIREVRARLPRQTPLICFAGAPFTLFCYLVEGRASKHFPTARAFLYAEPAASARLLDTLAEIAIAYLTAQAAAGAQALMLFDSWAGLLDRDTYARVCLPVMRKILSALERTGLPRLYFPLDGGPLLADAATLPLEVLGVDWRTPLSRARAAVGPGIALQGNLDPLALFAEDAELDRRIDRVLAEAGPGPGHIFNLGHGIEATTDPAKVARLVERVHSARTATALARSTA